MRFANPVQRIENALTLGLLFLAIGLPSADSLFALDPSQTPLLNRPLAKLPAAPESFDDVRAFPAAFEPFFDDRFGFKDFLIRSKSAIAIFGLGTSPSRNILLGRDRWLFLTGGIIGLPGRAIEDFTGRYPFTRRDLEEWRVYLERRHDVLRGLGIDFVFVIAPNKATIYPERLPSGLAAQRGRSRLDQLIEWLAREPKLRVVDLRPALTAAKTQGRLFEKTGTHWNERGGFAADAALARRLSRRFPQVRPLQAADYEPVAYDAPGRELAMMSGVADLMREKMWRMKPLGGAKARRAPVEYTPRHFYYEPPFATERGPKALPRAVIFHDSYYKALQPFLSEHFSRAVYYWQYDLDLKAVKAELPDVVIQLVSERVLLTRPGS